MQIVFNLREVGGQETNGSKPTQARKEKSRHPLVDLKHGTDLRTPQTTAHPKCCPSSTVDARICPHTTEARTLWTIRKPQMVAFSWRS
jgi:hypothetical protein